MEPENKKKIAFMAFGASQTEGYVCGKVKRFPYTTKLENLFKKNKKLLKLNNTPHFINCGISGETLYQMRLRLLNEFKCFEKENYEFKYIAILGGTNDVARDHSVEDMFDDLMRMVNVCQKKEMRIFLMTVPTNKIDGMVCYRNIKELKKEFNEKLREWCEKNKDNNVYLVDLAKDMDYSKLSKKERKKYWSDLIHYTESGYDHIADLIFKRFRESEESVK